MASSNGIDERHPLILLEEEYAKWFVCGNATRTEPVVYVRGYAHDGSRHFEDESFAKRIHELSVQGVDALRTAIPQLNGGWGLVVEWTDGRVLAAVDRMRCVPLFFYHNDRTLAIAASATGLARHYKLPLSLESQIKFLLFGYVCGGQTVFDGIRQVQPGEILEHHGSSGKLATGRYYRFYPRTADLRANIDLGDALEDILQRQFARFSDGYHDELVAIPLSGGLDSRLIAGMLKRNGITNCLCYTYGDETNEEVRISRQVAESLGFQWRSLPYTPEAFDRLRMAQEFRAYREFACKGVSAPVAHDFPAVVQLAADGHGGPKAIFFPGHSADMNAGSHIPPDYADLYTGKLSVIDEIIRHHARPTWFEPQYFLRSKLGESIVNEIRNESTHPDGAHNDPLACCEMWNAENRQAKYIINNVRAYEFVGARWRTLWDYEFMDFFLSVPTEFRYGQRLYLDVLRERIFVDDLSPLSEIPVAKHGALKALNSVRLPARPSTKLSNARSALKRRIRWQALRWKLANPVDVEKEQLIRLINELSGVPAVDGALSLRKLLERSELLTYIAPEVQQSLDAWLSMRADSVPGFAIYTIMVLAETVRSVTYPGSIA